MSKGRILIVEDEIIVARDIEAHLEDMGYEVMGIIPTGEEAVSKVMETAPDLILMDIRLQGDMDGVEAASYITKKLEIPVVYLTAHADDGTIRRAMGTRPFGYIVKPFNRRDLLSSIEVAFKRHNTEQHLQKERKWFKTVLKSIGDGVITTDEMGKVIDMNRVAEELTGWTDYEAKNRDLFDVFLLKDREVTVKKLMEQVLNKGLVVGPKRSILLLSKDGTSRVVDYNAAPIKEEPDKEVKGMVLVFRDVTERTKMEYNMQQAQKMESIALLAGGIAHDFNNLLMGLQGNVSLMLIGTKPGDKNYERLKNMEKFIQRGSNLTRQFLGFARQGQYNTKVLNINEVVKNVAFLFEETRKDITITTDLQENLWNIKADRSQLDQVLLNLLVNAWQAMPSGGEIHVTTKNVVVDKDTVRPFKLSYGKYIMISVADTGEGMEEEVMKRVFEPFFTTKKDSGGTGMGLSAVYGIVKGHGGFIDVQSKPGEGSTFSLYFPACEEEVKTIDHTGTSIPRGDQDMTTRASGKTTVLIVDDEEMVLSVGKEILETMNCQVLSANNGHEAIRIFKEAKGKIDLVICDIIMPEMDGAKLCERLKEIDPNIRILFSSGYAMDEKASALLKDPRNSFIQKPFNFQMLSEKISEVLSR